MANAGDVLEATAVATDDDPGDILSFDFRWYAGAILIHEDLAVTGSPRASLPGFFATSQLAAGVTTPGQTVRVVAKATDGTLWSAAIEVEVPIVTNAPVMESLQVSPI